MSVSIAQFDAHLKTMKGKHNYWNGIPGAQCMVVFASLNRLLAGPAYSAPGAKDLWNNAALRGAYEMLPASTVPRYGDIAIHGSTWGAGWGHISVVISNINSGSYNGFGQNPGVAATTVLSKAGMLGYLRPRALAAAAAPKPSAPAVTLRNRRVTQAPVAWIRTRPDHRAPLAPGWAQGIAKGAVLAIKGYVVGTDPYGTRDNAWYVTKSGYYVWANAAENTLAGLVKL